VLRSHPTNMSVWKSNFFLQTGLPESLPKPPERPAAVDEEFAADNDLPTTSRVGKRGKDKNGRKQRTPLLFNFFECMRSLESREADSNVLVRSEELRVEYHAHSTQQRAFWTYMHDLFIVFEQQNTIATAGSLTSRNAQSRKRKLWHKFYFIQAPEQQQLVRDYIAQRWERENYQFVQETCQQDNLRHLVEIRRDLRLLLTKVEKALAPKGESKEESSEECAPKEEPKKKSKRKSSEE
jgi:hypothetical protein